MKWDLQMGKSPYGSHLYFSFLFRKCYLLTVDFRFDYEKLSSKNKIANKSILCSWNHEHFGTLKLSFPHSEYRRRNTISSCLKKTLHNLSGIGEVSLEHEST